METELFKARIEDTAEICVKSSKPKYLGFLSAAEAVGLIGERDTAALLEHDRLRLSEEMTRRLRLVPVCGEGGDRLYFAFRPDSVTVGKKGARRDALVAVSDKDGKYYAGHPALAPSGIL